MISIAQFKGVFTLRFVDLEHNILNNSISNFLG